MFLILLLALSVDPYAPCKVTSYRLHDGDTVVDAEIALPFSVSLRNQSIRTDGYDAWEIDRTRRTIVYDKDELVKGAAALKALSVLLSDNGLWIDETGKRDPYGRINARLWTKDKTGKWLDVATWMKDQGHCRPATRELDF